MKRRPPRPTRTDTLVAYTTRFRSWGRPGVVRRLVSCAAVAFERAAPTPVDTAAWRPYGRSRLPSHPRRFPNAGRRLPLPERCRGCLGEGVVGASPRRSEEHTSELQSLMRISYAVFCLKKKQF